jgi:hypothetical protein
VCVCVPVVIVFNHYAPSSFFQVISSPGWQVMRECEFMSQLGPNDFGGAGFLPK